MSVPTRKRGNDLTSRPVQVLIATAGVLPPDPVADLVTQIAGADGQVTVMTVVEVPRGFLASTDDERRYFLNEESDSSKNELKAARYLEERGRRVVDPIIAAFRARGRPATPLLVEGSDPARAIVETAAKVGASLIVMGATRPLFTEESWGSVSAGVMQRTQCPLLLVPAQRPEEPPGPEP